MTPRLCLLLLLACASLEVACDTSQDTRPPEPGVGPIISSTIITTLNYRVATQRQTFDRVLRTLLKQLCVNEPGFAHQIDDAPIAMLFPLDAREEAVSAGCGYFDTTHGRVFAPAYPRPPKR